MIEPENMVRVFAVGHNMPGYLPESEVYYCDSWLSAKACMQGDIEHALDGLDYCEEGPDVDRWAQNLREAVSDLNRFDTGSEWGMIVDDSPSGTSYWISWQDMTESEWEEISEDAI